MKRFLIVTLIIVLTFCLICCGVDEEVSKPSESESQAQSVEGSGSGMEESTEGEESTPIASYTVTFDTDGGSVIEEITVAEGQKIQKPDNPEKSSRDGEYEFVCWLCNGVEWDFENDVVTENITLVAKWNVVVEYPPAVLPED